MSLVDFYTVMQDQPTASAHSRVISMTCYKSRRGVRHEYLILQVHSPQLTSRWIRLERAAQADMIKSTGLRNRFTSSSSTFVPDDTAIIAASPDLSFEDAKVMEHIIFSSVQQPSLWTLSKLLEAFCKESMVYTLPMENCWFFCSVMIENLAKHSGSNIKARNRALGRDARKRIADSFQKLLV
ncbi:hypothetical protein FRC09_020791 [Ceratobasidium sp. 395]|nr:hypothetical protein FRC09_020791 [Ceratobasidium sp. 395]